MLMLLSVIMKTLLYSNSECDPVFQSVIALYRGKVWIGR